MLSRWGHWLALIAMVSCGCGEHESNGDSDGARLVPMATDGSDASTPGDAQVATPANDSARADRADASLTGVDERAATPEQAPTSEENEAPGVSLEPTSTDTSPTPLDTAGATNSSEPATPPPETDAKDGGAPPELTVTPEASADTPQGQSTEPAVPDVDDPSESEPTTPGTEPTPSASAQSLVDSSDCELTSTFDVDAETCQVRARCYTGETGRVDFSTTCETLDEQRIRCASNLSSVQSYLHDLTLADACVLGAVATYTWQELPVEKKICELLATEHDETSCSNRYECQAAVDLEDVPLLLTQPEDVGCEEQTNGASCRCGHDPDATLLFASQQGQDTCDFVHEVCSTRAVTYVEPLGCLVASSEVEYGEPISPDEGGLPVVCELGYSCSQAGVVADQGIARRVERDWFCDGEFCLCEPRLEVLVPSSTCRDVIDACVEEVQAPFFDGEPDTTVYPPTPIEECAAFSTSALDATTTPAACDSLIPETCADGSHLDMTPQSPCPVCTEDNEQNRQDEWGAACIERFAHTAVAASGARQCWYDDDCRWLNAPLCGVNIRLPLNGWHMDRFARDIRRFAAENCESMAGLIQPAMGACVDNLCVLPDDPEDAPLDAPIPP